MNKTSIEWCTHSNPDAYACGHGCPFCYAMKIIHRFPMNFIGINQTFDRILDLNPLVSDKSITEIALTPHMNLKALYAPAELKKPAIVFRGSMTDLFGNWWPESFNIALLEAMREVNHHKYVVLTKNPIRLYEVLTHMRILNPDFNPGDFNHVYFGTSTDGSISDVQRIDYLKLVHNQGFKTVISFEPLNHDPMPLLLKSSSGIAWADWIIVGGQTNPVRIPDTKWVDEIFQWTNMGLPIFCKNNCGKVWENTAYVHDFPADLLPIAKAWGKA